ncbi:MAG: hypothetical protein GVY13_09235 [Alphaproteobacteria bacterium]|jgi:hypothetical protein|nr:hypothetical protein [Alphaproteobacteria bacterium]
MASTEDLIAWRDALEKALYAGVREVEYNGTRTTYRSQREMESALAKLNQRLGSATRVSKVLISSSKGL